MKREVFGLNFAESETGSLWRIAMHNTIRRFVWEVPLIITTEIAGCEYKDRLVNRK